MMIMKIYHPNQNKPKQSNNETSQIQFYTEMVFVVGKLSSDLKLFVLFTCLALWLWRFSYCLNFLNSIQIDRRYFDLFLFGCQSPSLLAFSEYHSISLRFHQTHILSAFYSSKTHYFLQVVEVFPCIHCFTVECMFNYMITQNIYRFVTIFHLGSTQHIALICVCIWLYQ